MTSSAFPAPTPLADGFVFLSALQPAGTPAIVQHLRYATPENFTGRIVPGYHSHRVILTRPAAQALWEAQKVFVSKGFAIIVYDAYRPQSSVNSFIRWSEDDDHSQKAKYYPFVDKTCVFDLGYLAKRSEHTRGSAVDMSIIPLGTSLKTPVTIEPRTLSDGQKILFLDDGSVDMGCSFDFFGDVSHHPFRALSPEALANRQFLRQTMEACGFEAYEQEWWHYKFIHELYPETYFDFEIPA